ncbi:transcriptional regulator [Luteibacter yeojuensis]|uniref:Transcriptional regulator n=1 Tax=Luteibacter yeojuensis TaxID=345309 RepID=A0A0F3KRR8_9GAMM|nr:transcriptional regulator [Luteibacter yeojuensis]
MRSRGLSSAAQLAAATGSSQPTVSRALAEAGTAITRIGRARRTRYAAVRDVRGLGTTWPLFRIDAQGHPQAFGDLTALHGGGSLVQAVSPPDWLRDEFVDGLFPGIPWFLDDQRPQGFLGRQFAQAWARELGLPADILRWSDDAVLAALLLHGEDGPGNFVIGTSALEQALAGSADALPASSRSVEYTRLAARALAGEAVGSSAAGEQPKFTARIDDGHGDIRHVIVKFSEPVTSDAGRRWADLLACEHVAGQVLAEHGVASPHTELLWSGERLCLESTRFDRVGTYGRRGFVTLAAWSDAHDGVRDDWASAADRMCAARWLTAADAADVRQRWWFGRMIGNTDMHFGNIGFFLDDALPLALAPSYDMLPMLYRPASNGAIVSRDLQPATPLPADMALWQRAAAWAEAFWARVTMAGDVSHPFREVAARNAETVARLRQRFGA